MSARSVKRDDPDMRPSGGILCGAALGSLVWMLIWCLL